MAAAATKKQQQPAAVAAGAGGPALVDPKHEWVEKAGSYVLRLALPGFRKDDFRVQVDGAGRLTVRGARPGTGAATLHKVFHLPASASLDDIAGRFEAGVLTLTVPKRASAGAGAGAAPTSIEEIKSKPGVAKETKPKEEEMGKEDALKKSMDEATNKAQEKKRAEEEEAKSRKQEQQKPSPTPMNKEEVVKPKAPQAAAAGPTPMKPAPEPEVATGDEKAKAAIAAESLAERVRRRGEEERAKAAAAATAATKAISEPEKKATPPACGGWKERVQGELKVLTDMKWAEGLTDMKWADGVVEAARKNKEVVAVGIAAFSLGFLVSQKLFRK